MVLTARETEMDRLNDEVFVAVGDTVKITGGVLDTVENAALKSEQSKCRLLLHKGADDSLHQMLIVNPQKYIRPHRNIDSAKSWHIIKGRMVFVRFDDEGDVIDYCQMDCQHTHNPFMIRLSDSCFHTLIPITKKVTYIETILGPFKGTIYASWAPEDNDALASKRYYDNLCNIVGVES
jgi:cupin fold WbuC family metalloprotein